MSAAAEHPSRPPGQVRVFADYDRDLALEADAVVVGSGPAGAIVTHRLAEAGHRVVLVEEGPPFTPRDFRQDAAESMTRTLRDGGLRTTMGHFMPVLQACALGGGSLVNSAMCVRPPAWVFDEWCTRFDLEHTTRDALDPHFDAVADFLGIAPTPDSVQGARNLLFKRGCDALGAESEPVERNVRGCRGSGECFTGCRPRAKQSMDVSYIPAAIGLGAEVLTSVQVQRVRASRTRAYGIEGRVVEPFTGRLGHRVRVDAKVVVLAAGCMATPVLLQRSGDLANGSGQVGRNLQFHPGTAAAGVFEEPVDPLFGGTQSYQSLYWLREGFKLETLWTAPAALGVRMPGVGASLVRHLAAMPHTVVFDAICSTHRSLGTVRARSGSLDPAIHWRLHPEDAAIMLRSVEVLCRVLDAAGAERILPGVHGLPEVITRRDEIDAIGSRDASPGDFTMASSHVFCTTRMHGRADEGVVDETGRCHDLDNLYIADTGVFPRCTSVNPMFTVMALAHRQGGALADRL